MASVVPTLLSSDAKDYSARLERVKLFAKRIHIDISDGRFSPTKTLGLAQVYGFEGCDIDLHLMLQRPAEQFETSLSLHPSLVICHFESEGDIQELLARYRSMGVRAGLAILPDTGIRDIQALVEQIDHLLVFSGRLGHNGGQFDKSVLKKISEAKQLRPELEVSVDGGINEESAAKAAHAGADILYSGGFIHNASDPKAAYHKLERAGTV